MTISILFLLIALICFVLSAFGVGSRVNLQSAGLACCVVAFLIPGRIF